MKLGISKSEKLDIFLVLANGYRSENKVSEQNSDEVLEIFSTIDNRDFIELKVRFKKLKKLPTERQKIWQKVWLEKLRTHGETSRLDENIHPAQISQVLKNEPLRIQQIILENLPSEKTTEILQYLSIDLENSKKNQLPMDDISEILRKKFLSNFVSFENVYQPNEIDELNFLLLEKFIQKLGIRETAISCRGITTKENLAIFLKPFDDQMTKEIAIKIKEFGEINPLRVLRSEKIVNDIFQGFGDYQKKLNELGLQLLAMSFVSRDEVAVKFTAQKLSVENRENFEEMIKRFIVDGNKKLFEEIGLEVLELARELKEENQK